MSKTRFSSEWLRERGFAIVDGKAVPVIKKPLKTAFDLLGEKDPKALCLNLDKAVQPEKTKAKKSRKPEKTQRLNQTEQKFQKILISRFPSSTVQPQFRIRITPYQTPSLVHYTADFAVWTPEKNGWTCRLWEVKHAARPYHSDELTRPKMAGAENPWVAEIWLAIYDGKAFTEKLLSTNQPNQ